MYVRALQGGSEEKEKREGEKREREREREREKVGGERELLLQWLQVQIRWVSTSLTFLSLALLPVEASTGVVSLTAVDTANSLL